MTPTPGNQPPLTQIGKSAPTAQPYRITLPFGSTAAPFYSPERPHVGTDMSPYPGAYGTPLYAVFDGDVLAAGWSGNYGNLIRIASSLPFSVTATNLKEQVATIPAGSEFELWYGHCAQINVNTYERVSAGRQVGSIGSTGLSSGAHLHLELRHRGEFLNVLDVLHAAEIVSLNQWSYA